MAKKDEKLQSYEELTTQMNATTVTLDAEKRQKLHEILHQKPEFAQLLEKFKALCSDDETRHASIYGSLLQNRSRQRWLCL